MVVMMSTRRKKRYLRRGLSAGVYSGYGPFVRSKTLWKRELEKRKNNNE
jgi:hypothetical protein